jgi:hypothetical protein
MINIAQAAARTAKRFEMGGLGVKISISIGGSVCETIATRNMQRRCALP